MRWTRRLSSVAKTGLSFYAVNRNYPEEVFDETISRKIDAEIYIDDKNIGGFRLDKYLGDALP